MTSTTASTSTSSRIPSHRSRAHLLGPRSPVPSRSTDAGGARQTGGRPPPTAEGTCWALPVVFLGRYDPAEDDFEGDTFFAHPKTEVDDDDEDSQRLGAGLARFRREHKRLCGFIFLRTLRTGSRALSLQRGSLLDTTLRLGGGGLTEMWQDTLERLHALKPPIGDIPQLKRVREEVRNRISQFVNLAPNEATAFFASDLTRVHLRDVVRFFAASEKSGHLVPFQRLGTGAINMLVFALLTFIADLKGKGSVIFAMEEPEIALPPHTQRRVIRFILSEMGQAIVTSHSPYVIEQFEPTNVVILDRGAGGTLSGSPVQVAPKAFRTERRQFAEAVLSRAVLVVEGSTEAALIPAVAAVLEEAKGADVYTHPDLSGLTIFDARSDSLVPRYGPIFKALGKKAFSFRDKGKQPLSPDAQVEMASYDQSWESPWLSIEDLLVNEVAVAAQRRFLDDAASWPDYPSKVAKYNRGLTDDDVKRLCREVLIARKGQAHGYAAHLIGFCTGLNELPSSLTAILEAIHNALSLPPPLASVRPAHPPTEGAGDDDS